MVRKPPELLENLSKRKTISSQALNKGRFNDYPEKEYT